MFSKFFIDRPVFASVLSIIIVLAGLVSIWNLPNEQYPEITPPTVSVRASYPGASAEVVASSLAAPIEQELSGAKNMLYYATQCSNDGTLGITVTFETGTDIDLAAVEVQNRVARAEPRLPQESLRQGIVVTKRSSAILLVVTLQSETAEYDDLFLNNFATVNVLDTLKRVPGAGDVMVFGAKDYSMRLWLNPDRMANLKLTVSEVANAVREQNGQFAAGRVGQEPNAEEVLLTFPVITRGRLEDPKEFENVILRSNPDGSMVRVKDVGRAELGAQSYDLFGRRNGTPTALLPVYLQPGANALDTKDAVIAAMEDLEKSFPKGIYYGIPYDTTTFITESIKEVLKTFIEAIILVLIVVYVFLQNWRAALIPLLAVPVSIIGTFAGMIALGYTINTLTLFGLILAIGIVVDDAIVVVENVERIMEEEHLPVREATIKAMDEVTGPVIAIVLVLCAVFVPVAFLGGLTGQLYKQFAVTIAISVTISGIVALTLSPALCRLLLKHSHKPKRGPFKWFNTAFDWMTRGYVRVTKGVIRFTLLSLIIFGICVWAIFHLMKVTPTGFIPEEDQGSFIVAILMPDGASLDRTNELAKEVEQFVLKQPEVANIVTLGGMNLLSGGVNSTNASTFFVSLKPWAERPEAHVNDVLGRLMGNFGKHPDGIVLAFNPPPIRGLGMRSGFEMQLQARAGQDVRQLAQVTDDFIKKLGERPEIDAPNGTLSVNLPQLYVDLNREKAKAMGVNITEIFDTLQAYFGALYVNDFNKYGRVYRVQLQAEPEFRNKPEDIGKLFVKNGGGNMVPMNEIVSTSFRAGPNVVSRFNGFTSVQITGAAAPGFATGDTMVAINELAADLPAGYDFEWSGASYQEVEAGNKAPMVMAFGLLVVFLVLAAQYERWGLPIAVMLAVPLGVLGALVAIYLREINRDIYFQIGLLTLVGLSAKNAILIVEFCVVLRESGKGIVESALQAARLRFRPILMTSFAFILGVVPLAISTGAGAAGRQSIGTGVVGGMLAATILSVFFVPMFYVLVTRVTEWLSGRGRHHNPPPPGPGGSGPGEPRQPVPTNPASHIDPSSSEMGIESTNPARPPGPPGPPPLPA